MRLHDPLAPPTRLYQIVNVACDLIREQESVNGSLGSVRKLGLCQESDAEWLVSFQNGVCKRAIPNLGFEELNWHPQCRVANDMNVVSC